MPIVPVRSLAKFGVITDPDPYDLPPQAWTFGKNLRFKNGRVIRGPVFRNVKNLGTADPRFCFSSNPTSGLDLLFLGYKSGRVYRYNSGVETDYSITDYTDASSEGVWTSTHLADIVYVNREDRIPWSFSSSDSAFLPLENWNANWRTRLLRTCGGALVALNVTKSGVNFPTMVKASDIPVSNTVPSSWDETDETLNTYENILAEMEGPIVDGCSLGDVLCIYGTKQTFLMQADGSSNVYRIEKAPFESHGAISTNCSIEVGGKNFVFGVDDIWVHDGVTDVSICEGLVKDYIFSSINISKANRCFVTHNPRLKEISFHYVSGDEHCAFASVDGCNRSAIYNYQDKTWVFDDLPYVYSGCIANLDNTRTWADMSDLTWDTFGGSWLDLEDSFKKNLVYVGDTLASAGLTKSLYAFDQFGKLATLAFPVDENATALAYLEKIGIDLDDVGKDLQGYVTCSSIIPQGRLDADAMPIVFTVGAADYFSQDPTYFDPQTFDGQELYKLDFNDAGRWLAIKIEFDDYKSMSLSGFDFDLEVTAER